MTISPGGGHLRERDGRNSYKHINTETITFRADVNGLTTGEISITVQQLFNQDFKYYEN
jgi:hypothetical protein